MAEQKNQNEHLNVEDALTQSEAFLIIQKRNYWRCCCCDYYCSRFYHVQNLYAEPRRKSTGSSFQRTGIF